MNKNEFKIFLTFLLISSLFSYWTSWNEETNFALIGAIVNNNSFYLDDYKNVTGDVFFSNGHYFAYFARWAFSTFGSDIYFFLKLFDQNENFIKFLLTVSVSSLFFSLSVLLFFKFTKMFIKEKKSQMFLAFTYGFSTLAFQQARFFTTHSAETFFTLLAIYLLFRSFKKRRTGDIVISTILISFAILLTLIARIIFFFMFLIFLSKKRIREALIFLFVAITIYILFCVSFSLSVQQALAILFSISYKRLSFFPEKFESVIFPLPNLLQLLIFPSKGILFYYPILIFSFLGFFFIKKYKTESFLFLLFIIITLLFISLLTPMWWFGWVSYGPVRVLTILMPFFSLGLIGFVKKFGFKVLIPFFLISALNNFLLLQYGEDKISTMSWEDYKYKMEHFQILSNPLFDHYLPLTLVNGPRSILLENLIIDKKISIDFKHFFNPATPEFIPPGSPIMKKFEVYLFFIPKVGIVVLRLPWLSLFISSLILTVIWKDYIFGKIKINYITLFLIFGLIFFLLFIRVRNIAYGDGWCAPEWNENEKKMEDGRWIGRNATLFLLSDEEKTLRFTVESLNKGELKIYLNNKFVGGYTIEEKGVVYQQLNKGINKIVLVTQANCTKPWLNGVNCDADCINFKISNISFV